jgi:glycerol uptake facilitator protein
VVAAPYSGAHLNPAVSLALAIVGKFEWHLLVIYVPAQLLGAFAGACITWLVYRDHFDNTNDPDLQLAVFSTAPAIRNPRFNLLSEAVGTFVLIFVVFYFTDAEIREPRASIGLGSIGALPVAFLVWAIGLSLGGTTGYAINPARDFSPRIAHWLLPIKGKGSSNWQYAWVPVAGPLLGALAAAGLYLLFEP